MTINQMLAAVVDECGRKLKKDKNALPRPPAMGATHVEEELHNVPKVAFSGHNCQKEL